MPLLVNCHRTVQENKVRLRSCHEKLRRLVSRCKYFHEKEILLLNLTKLRDCGIRLASVAPCHDFSPQVQGNGFRTVLELGLQFMRFGIKRLEAGTSDFLPDYVIISSIFVQSIPVINQLIEACETSGSLACNDLQLTCQLFYGFMRSEKASKSFFNEVGNMDSGPTGIFVFKVLYYLRALTLAPNFCALVRCIRDKSYRVDLLFTACRKSTVSSMNRLISGSIVHLTMRHVYPALINGWNPCIAYDISIPRQQKFTIRLDLDDELCPKIHRRESASFLTSSSPSISCRIFRPHNKTPTALLIYAHGGGFAVANKYTSDVFHKYWITRVPGLAILSFDYTLLPHARFPTQVQECLDLFLYFSDENKRQAISEQIGFFPEKMFLSGDSAGACLALATTLVLTEIRRTFVTDLKLPDALFLLYPWLNIHPDVRPSFLVSGMTTLFHAAGFYDVMRSYIPTWDKTDFNHNTSGNKRSGHNVVFNRMNSLPIIRHLMAVLRFFWNTDTKIPEAPVKACNARPHELEQQVVSSCRLSKHPFVSPAYFQDWESLEEVKLYIASCSHDSLLDEAVVLAKKWRGTVRLDVLNNVQHAFLMLMMTENSRQAADLIAARLTQWI